MPARERVITFRPDNDIFEAMTSLRERDGVPFSEQIRRSLRAWLESKGVMRTAPNRGIVRKRASTGNKGANEGAKNTLRFLAPRGENPRSPVLIQKFCQLGSEKSGTLLTIATYLHPAPGCIDVRCTYGNADNLLKSQVCAGTDEARAIAEDWRQHALSNGFTEVKAGH